MTAYLFLGADKAQKDAQINEIKKRFLPSRESHEFDHELLYGHKLDSDTLKKSLLALPAVTAQRVIVLRQCDKLDPHNRELLLEFLRQKNDNVVVILESETMGPGDSFATALKPYVRLVDLGAPAVKNVFDMMRLVGMRQSTEALTLLFQLVSAGTSPVQIMGGMVWSWGRSRDRMPAQRFQEGLKAMQEADLSIKRSRLKPEYALELLVVKLCSL